MAKMGQPCVLCGSELEHFTRDCLEEAIKAAIKPLKQRIRDLEDHVGLKNRFAQWPIKDKEE